MKEEFKFILVTRSDGKKMAINVDQIVAVIKQDERAVIITTNPDAGGEMIDRYEDVISMLPSSIKFSDLS